MAFKKIESKIGFAPMKWAVSFPFGNLIGQAELAFASSIGKNRSLNFVRLNMFSEHLLKNIIFVVICVVD